MSPQILGGALAGILFMQGAIITGGVSAGLLVIVLACGGMGLSTKSPQLYYWYMSFSLVWIPLGVVHMIWVLGFFVPGVSNQTLWVGKTLAAKFALKSGATGSTSTSTSAVTVAAATLQAAGVKTTVASTVAATKVIQAATVKAAAVATTTRAATVATTAKATTLAKRDFAGVVPTDVPESSIQSAADIKSQVLQYLEKQNDWFLEKKSVVDQTKSSHILYPRQAATTTVASTVSGSTSDPMTGMVLPGVYGAHLLFLIIGFSCCLLLPLLPDGKRTIDEDNPFGNMTAEEIATAHLKNQKNGTMKNKRATSMFHRMTHRMTRDPNRNTIALNNMEISSPTNNGPNVLDYKKGPLPQSNMGDYDKGPINYSKGGYDNKQSVYGGNDYNKQSVYNGYGYDKNDYKQSMYDDPRGKSVYDYGKNDRYTRNDDDLRDTYYQPKSPKMQGPKKGNMVPMKGGDDYDDPLPGIVMMVVIRAYRPALEDEVDLEPGDIVEVEDQFEDGFAQFFLNVFF
ncbi:hypothetical protein HK096_003219 [Nowakowskiella sp. JEL0078]|nr:hypothetical protein HK096_003219 [Nowakowskiella sp. JEL0078]